jgi:anhydro-N-acetylmuramic acid kinase
MDRLDAPAPDCSREQWSRLTSGDSSPSSRKFTAQLTAAVAEVVATLLARHKKHASNVLAIGLQDPGSWRRDDSDMPPDYRPIVDATQLAEQTGLNVVNGFAARDVAARGLGGPLEPLAAWLLLRHQRRPRLLIDLGRTARLTYLPRYQDHHAPGSIIALDVVPCGSLLDALCHHATGGQIAMDAGGRAAVQGRLIQSLYERWLAEPDFCLEPPRWAPLGLREERYLADFLANEDEDVTLADCLTTATQWMAEAIARAIHRLVPETDPRPEVFVSGGGTHNGFLISQLQSRLPRDPLVMLAEREMDQRTVDAASAAMLAILCLDQTPASLTQCTGCEVSRILGQLTPGSPWHWHRLLKQCGIIAGAMTLRSAV